MPDPRFFRTDREWTLGELAQTLALDLPETADGDMPVTGVASLADAAPGELAFFADPRERAHFASSRAGAIVTRAALVAETAAPQGAALILTEHPQALFVRMAQAMYGAALAAPECDPAQPRAADAELGADVRLGPGVVIGAGARIGAGSVIGANAVIGPGVVIGPAARIGHNSSLRYCRAGERLSVASGVRIGETGFGFRPDGAGGFADLPHLGRVLIGDDVSIGANSCIDRGSLGDTVIGDWTRIDNLCQIGHNARIGRRCIMAGLAAISGSVDFEDDVVLGAQVTVADHIRIGRRARIGGASFVNRDVPAGGDMFGVPAIPLREKLREIAMMKKQIAQRRDK